MFTLTTVGTHTFTATYGGLTATAAVDVTPVVATVPTVATPAPGLGSAPIVTVTAHTAPRGVTRDGLAFTGSDSTGMLAWALGLLAAGAAVTIARFRRRRAQR